MLECVVNISEGRDAALVRSIADAAPGHVLDVHRDAHHHRSVLTLVGEDAARAVASAAVGRLDLRGHDGVHPRLGVVDVVPFVALEGSTPADALAARDRFTTWFAAAHRVPCFRYGPERTLPDVRRGAFTTLHPDAGPAAPHPSAGATAVGARPPLVAYNVWLAGSDLGVAAATVRAVRGPQLRALALQVGTRLQVSMNLVDPASVGPAQAHDLVARVVEELGGAVAGAELVGLLPAAVLDDIPRARWAELDVGEDRTIEARLAGAGYG